MRRTMMLGLLATLIAGGAQAQQAAPQPGKTYRVGFSQIVDHPALNATRAGFLEALKEAGFIEGKNLKFDYLNAQGDVANARTIAEKFIADKVDLIAPCTTPNVQAALRLGRDAGIPIAFGCVTNPIEGGILKSLEQPTGANFTGIYGIPPVAKMFDLVKQLAPNAKIVGTIYNPSEANSVALNAAAKKEAVARGLTWGEVQVTSTGEVYAAAAALATKVDIYIMPQDNTIASAFDAVVRAARDAKKPIFSFDTSTVERGAVAAFAQNQHQAGVDWGREIAVPILLGKAPGTIVPVAYKAYDLLLNKAAAKQVGVDVPEDLVKAALRVFDN